ncbi:MAG: hypothetical protein OQK69_04620 [Gammaproteobacteria bacterium]|nr:hypothetical protein [Gammaproteobacteria bacterium]
MSYIKNNYFKLMASVFFLLLASFSVTNLFDAYGEQYTDEGFKRSVSAFAIAKGLNGVISVVQGTEVAVEPAGIGLILTPGQILDPANDLIERFSWVMLVCTTSLGIQSILLKMFSSFYFSAMVAVLLFLMVLFIWNDKKVTVDIKNILYRFVVFLIILRFFIPVMAIASDAVYKAFLETSYVESTQQLEQSNELIANLSKENQAATKRDEDAPWYELLSDNINAAIDSFDVDKRVEQLKVEADNLMSHIIDLIVVFTMQTILLPLVFIWLSMRLVKVNFSFKYFSHPVK